MKLYAKVGTGPGRNIHVMRIRNLPVVGQRIKFKENSGERYDRWEKERGGVVCEIRQLHGQTLFVIERM